MKTGTRKVGNAEGIRITNVAMRDGLEAAKWRNRKPRKTVPKNARTDKTLARHQEWNTSTEHHMMPSERDEAFRDMDARKRAEANRWLEEVKERKRKKIAESLARLAKKTKPAGKLPITRGEP